ncbi:MAG: UDP-N-acetylmuramate dehydrogenase [Bacteroidales bacterium]|jgi:UDP-N-acetylmuramate dehydrogenase|nr:UDP-N-acetylmuramate dehydrogenase [Bacteroidales bacterium]
MFEIKENFSLKNYNTFGIDVKTKYFLEYSSVNELSNFLVTQRKQNLPLMNIGGGSNVLFTKDFEGYILHSKIKGVEIIKEDDDNIYLRVGAGDDWDEFVDYCVKNGWCGVENLSLIPGNVGTCPIQNIGAYGVEVKDVITELETTEIDTLKKTVFTNKECQFAYRDSIFKREFKGKHIINYVTFCLNKKQIFKLDYGNLKNELKEYEQVNLQNIRQAVINIRESKLPDPETIGNAGSFFKNPVVHADLAENLKKSYVDIPCYFQNTDLIKIPAGWLIEKAGWKGKNIGNVGVHNKQALVLINNGGATGMEVLDIAKEIQKSVKDKFGIDIEMEVNVV